MNPLWPMLIYCALVFFAGLLVAKDEKRRRASKKTKLQRQLANYRSMRRAFDSALRWLLIFAAFALAAYLATR